MIQLSGSNILTYSSPLMFVVAHKLVLKEPIPDLWYKDNGRKGKWIPLHLQLVNEHNYLVRSRNVPLQLSLHYSCGSLVPNQTLLKYTPMNPHISDNGEIIIHFRIEEVSRSHQNQLFMIRVSPDIVQFPLNNDINSVETTPIRPKKDHLRRRIQLKHLTLRMKEVTNRQLFRNKLSPQLLRNRYLLRLLPPSP
jgi:hypothetical protein